MIKSGFKLRQAFLSLLRAGLWGTEPDCEHFPLDMQEWELLHQQALRQTVNGLIYDGILRLPVFLYPPSLLIMRWTAEVDNIERRNIQMNKALEHIDRWLKENGVRAWLLKGQGVASFYRQPLHRECGDIDLYFPCPCDAEKVIQRLKAEGVTIEQQAGMSITYNKAGCLIDQHARLIDIHNPFKSRYIKRLIRMEAIETTPWHTASMNIALPSPLLTHVISNAHILKHLMAVGIGFRQLCDSARICSHYHSCIDGEQLEQVYREVGLYSWIQVLHRVLVEELGMPKAYLPFPLSAARNDKWLKTVWQGGNFGFYDERVARLNSGNRAKRMFYLFKHHFMPQIHYAPAEAFWFPLVQVYSRYCRRIK